MGAVFLFNLMCLIVTCDNIYKPPEPKAYVESSQQTFLKGFRAGKSLDFDDEDGNSTIITAPVTWKPSAPIVRSKSGVLEGYYMKVVNGREVYAFEGIPFAEPPLGDRRFRAPVPVQPWPGIRQAKRIGNVCTQMHLNKMNRVIGNENCLFLNIYTPEIPVEGYLPKKDVVIFIHGGGFIFGAGSEFGPALLLQKDVVLVTLNYRLGPLGFLSSGDEESPGNWGLKDQALAIKWVSENVEHFGGNPASITLMGQSAGAASVHLQLISNQSSSLFHRAVSMSGSAFNFWAVHTQHQARKWTEKLAKFMRCPTSSSAKMINCFRKTDANFLTANQQNLQDLPGFPPILFRPVIEPDLPGAFLTMSPKQAYEQGQIAKIPFIATTVKDEADYVFMVLRSLGFFWLWLRHWEQVAPTMLDYRRIAGDNTSAITDAIAKFYLRGIPANEIWRKVSDREIAKIGSDRYFHTGNRKALQFHSQVAPTYSYIFSIKNTKGWANMFGRRSIEEYGVSHMDDLGFLFNSSTYWEAFDENKDKDMTQVVDLMLNLFGNFISKGEPLYTGDDGKDYQIWEPVTDPNNPVFLQIDQKVEMISEDPIKADIEFWEGLHLNESYPFEYA